MPIWPETCCTGWQECQANLPIMSFIESILPALSQSAVFLLIFYGLFVLVSILLFLRYRSRHDWPLQADAPAEWPAVTLQIPIYNERQVAARVVQAVAGLDYPSDKLQIQVLDDSTDNTSAILSRLVTEL